MKFKWIGPENMVDVTLVLAGKLPMEDPIPKGKIIELKQDDPLVKRLRMNANWEEVKTIKEAKKEEKKTKGGNE